MFYSFLFWDSLWELFATIWFLYCFSSVGPIEDLIQWHCWPGLVHPCSPCSEVIFLKIRQSTCNFIFWLGIFAMLVGQERVFFAEDNITNSFFLITYLLLTDRKIHLICRAPSASERQDPKWLWKWQSKFFSWSWEQQESFCCSFSFSR